MGVILLAIALVSGFIFTSLHLPARYKQKRSQGWESYFHVAAWGTLCSFIGGGLFLIADYFDVISLIITTQHRTLEELNSVLTLSISDFKLIAFSGATLLTSLMFGWLSKKLYSQFPELKTKTLVRLVQNNRLDALLLEASLTQFPILLSLKSRKVYVGICFIEPAIDSDNDFIEILPLLSGYREKDSLELIPVTNYRSHYEKVGIINNSHEYLELSDFRVVVSKSELDSASFFDIDTFIEFQNESKIKKRREVAIKKTLPKNKF